MGREYKEVKKGTVKKLEILKNAQDIQLKVFKNITR
jgi:hypothetical protein